MCKAIADLLGVSNDSLRVIVRDLEVASGHPSNDVRLTAEIVGKVHMSTKALGLDPSDTTGPELYHALLSLADKHNEFLVRRMGAKLPDGPQELAPKIIQFINKLRVPDKVWAIKPTAIKRLLKQQVPRRAMKALGYRSLDSLLKREPIARLVLLLPLLESERWYELFVQRYQQLTPIDFEQRGIELISLDGPKWRLIAEELHRISQSDVVANKELGVIAVIPYLLKQQGYAITRMPIILREMSELRLHSAYLKLMQTRPNFGHIVAESVGSEVNGDVFIGGHPVTWRSIHHHIAREKELPEIFEPHVTTDDFLHYRTEEILYRLEPALHFWHDMEFVGTRRDGETISFNLLDVSHNLAANKPFTRQVSKYLKTDLSNQLVLRYMALPHVETRVLSQLDYQVFDPELLALNVFEEF